MVTQWWDDPAWPIPAATDRHAWGEGLPDPEAARAVVERARQALESPWPTLPASGWARIHRDRDRDSYEQVLWARERRLTDAAVAAAVTAEQRFIDDVGDGVWALCEQSSWCWPAHDETHSRTGAVLPDVESPCLDLGAGEVAAQLAWLDRLLGADLDQRLPGLRDRVRLEVRRRVLTPMLERQDWHWLGLHGDAHNWTAWIHGNVLVAALVFAEPDQRSELVRRCLAGLRRYANCLPDDGAIDEGSGYWWNGACRALEAAGLVAHASRGTASLVDGAVGLRASVAFPHHMHLGGEWTISFSDAQARRDPAHDPWHALFAAARLVGDQDATAFALSQRRRGVPSDDRGLGRLLASLQDRDWANDPSGQASHPGSVWFPSVQVLVARQQPGSCSGLTVAVKGGHNAENHNHNDLGSLIVAVDGIPVVVDPGRPTYTLGMFGDDRYDTWVLTSDAHSVPRPHGLPQRAGADRRAELLAVDHGPHGAEVVLDLSGAHDLPPGSRWVRGVSLDRGAGAVVVDDQWRLSPGVASQVAYVLAGEVTLDAERTIRATHAGRQLLISLSGGTVRLQVVPLADPMLTSVWGTDLTIAVVDVDGLERLVATMRAA
ncbi:heparinase II/III domain-containing protein [Aestuariimicrobium ganziense]|uniref:heparinase II/III domain-containing protein n=1 Tax=Aestuariimicrobium ganziense TaxID=2773677 RepID=UPI0019454A56|nr:heparinase II/III family protein [Aestuariimicrobium ganziense]